jgi:hypothetical protein
MPSSHSTNRMMVIVQSIDKPPSPIRSSVRGTAVLLYGKGLSRRGVVRLGSRVAEAE